MILVACLAVHDIDKMAIGVDYDRDGKYYWWCSECQHKIFDADLPPFHKYYPKEANDISN